MNHTHHTLVAITAALQLAFSRNHWTPSYGILATYLFTLIYLIFMNYLMVYQSVSVYSFMAVFNGVQILTFYAGNVVVLTIFYLLGEFITKTSWQTESDRKSQLKFD